METKRVSNALSTLYEIVKVMNSTRRLDDLLNLIISESIKLLGATNGSLLLREDSSKNLITVTALGESLQTLKKFKKIKIGQGVIGWVAQYGESLLVPNVNREPRYIKASRYVKSELTVPLIREGKVIGVLDLNSNQYNKFDQFDLEIATILASQAAVSIHNTQLYQKIKKDEPSEHFIGKSSKILAILKLVETIANSDAAVLIQGESGTGKEMVAFAIHQQSFRKDKPFVAVSCGVLAEGVIESELFGHEKGAFTGAFRQKKGKFELADGGTLFLDEITEISPGIQVKLLRVLQEQQFERVGGTEPIHVNLRIIAATNRNIQEALASKSFREDLFYRLNVIPIELPPLRERIEDIPILAMHFLKMFREKYNKNISEISSEVMNAFLACSWPGNVRELKNSIERMVILEKKMILNIETSTLPSRSFAESLPHNLSLSLKETIRNTEKEFITNIIFLHNKNISKAAKGLKITRQHLYRKIKDLQIYL
jgi:Nif-specific regulatory protein